MLPTIDQVQNELKRRRGSSQSWTPTGYNSSQQSSSPSAPASTVPTIDQVQAELDRRRKKREQEDEKKQRERTAAAQKTAGSAIRGGASALQSDGLLQTAKQRSMTPSELNRQYDDVQKQLSELKRTGRTYGVMQSGGVYNPAAESKIKELEREQADILQLIQQKQTAKDLSKPSSYWKQAASEKEAALQEAQEPYRSGRNYAGMMQGGVSAEEAGIENWWRPLGVSQESREYDTARENYYYTMNAERLASLPEGLKNRVMEAASLSTTSLLGWKDENPDGKILDAEGKREQRRADTARLESLKGDIAAAGYDADALIEYAARMRDAERRQKMEEDVAATANSGLAGKVAATVASYGASAVSGIGSIGILAQRVFGSGSGTEDYRPVNINTPAQSFAHYTTAARGAVSEDMGETGKFLYGTLNSAVDSAVRLLIGKAAASGFVPSGAEAEAAEQVNKLVSGLVSAQMGTQVFTNSFIEAKESGKTDDQAIVDAVVSAAIEAITEKYSVEEIIKNPNGLTAQALANSFAAEASEEMASNVLNTIYDELQYGDESRLRSQAQAYIDAGMDPAEAWKIVLKEYGQEVLLDGLAGGISGFGMSAVNEVGNRLNERAYNRILAQAQERNQTAPAASSETESEETEASKRTAQKAAGVVLEDGSNARVQNISYKDGSVSVLVETEDGKTSSVNPKNVQMPEETAELVSLASEFKAAAPVVFAAYEDGQDIASYKDAAELVVATARASVGVDGAKALNYLHNSKLTEGLTTEQIDVLYQAGRELGIAEPQMIRRGTGTVTWEAQTNRKKMKGRQKASVQFIEDLAKSTGLDFVIYETKADESGSYQGAQGYYARGKIGIDLNAGMYKEGDLEKSAMLRTVSHELTHFLKDAAGEQYAQLQGFMIDHLAAWSDQTLDDLITAKMSRSTKGSISYEEALDEVVADGCEMMLRDSAAIRQLAETNKTLFQRVRDWVGKFLKNLREAFKGLSAEHQEAVYLMENYADELQKLWDTALTASVENNKKASKVGGNTTQEGGVTLNDAVKNSERIVDQIRASLSQIMALDSVYTIDPSNATPYTSDRKEDEKSGNAVFKAQGGIANRHGFGRVVLSKRGAVQTVHHGNGPAKQAAFPAIKAVIEHGIEIYRDNNHNGQGYDTVTFSAPVTFFGEKAPLAVVVKSFESVNSDKTFYIHEICDAEGNYIQMAAESFNKKISSTNFVEPTSTVSAADGITPNTSIRPDSEDVKNETVKSSMRRNSDRDSNGSQLSDGQQTYFAESKVRDSNGQLMVMYRGDASDVTVFDRKRSKPSNLYGRGFYFTSSKSHASQYGSAQSYYLNITNPLSTKDRTITRAQMRKFIQAIAEDEDFGLGNYGYGSTVDSVLRQVIGAQSDFAMLQDVSATAIGDLVAAVELFNDVNGTAFDGFILPTETVIFHSEQAKLTSNVTPTTNSDTRFSERDQLASEISSLEQQIKKLEQGKSDAFLAGQMRAARQAGKEVRKATERIEKLQGQLADARQLAKDTKKATAEERKKAEFRAKNLEAQIKKLNRDLAAMQKKDDALLADAMHKGGKDEATIRKLREELARKQEEYREGLRDYRAKRNESESVRYYRERVQKRVRDLQDLLITNSDKKHVPEGLKEPLTNFLYSLDLSSTSKLEGKRITKADLDIYYRAEQLGKALEKTRNGKTEKIDYFDFPDDMMDRYNALSNTIHEITAGVDAVADSPINLMNAAQLQDLNFVLRVLQKSINDMNKLLATARFQTVAQAAESTISELDQTSEYNLKGKLIEKFRSAINWKNTTPVYAFRRMGEAGQELFRAMWDGQGKFAFDVKEVLDKRKEIVDDKQVRKWSAEVHTIELSEDRTVRMTTAQLMSFYCLSKRKQAMDHLKTGGIRVANINYGNSHIQQSGTYYLSLDDIAKINSMVTEEIRQAADAIQKYMTERGSEWGNEISMQRFGYRAFTEKVYFPIRTEESQISKDTKGTQENSINRLLNMSFTKATTQNAQTSVVIDNIFDVFSGHMSDMAKYHAFALPVLDMIKWFDYNVQDFREVETEKDHRSVKSSITKAYGKEALQYIETFLKDVNGADEGGRTRGAEGYQKLMSHYKAASVGANLRVAIQQPTSYWRAASVINPKYLAMGERAGLNIKPYYEEMTKYAGISVWKEMGFRDFNVGRSVRDQISGTLSAASVATDKVMDTSMKLAEWGDTWTWCRLWAACKSEVKAKQHLSGEELLKATAVRFNEVISQTQVVDSVMTRSHMMRSKNFLDQILTPFMAEPTLSYNMVADSVFQLATDARKTNETDAWKKNRKRMAVAFMTFALTAVYTAFYQSLLDALRDDDDYEKFWEKFWDAFWLGGRPEGNFSDDPKAWIEDALDQGNIVANLNLVNNIPGFHREILNLLKGFSNEAMYSSGMKNLYNATLATWEKFRLETGQQEKATDLTWNGNMTWFGVTQKDLQAFSQLTGLPVYNLVRDAASLWNLGVGEFMHKPELKMMAYDPGTEKRVAEAYGHGFLSFDDAMEELQKFDVEANDAYFMLTEAAGFKKYERLTDAVLYGGDVQTETQALLDHGVKQKDIYSSIRTAIKEWYVGKEKDDGSREAPLIDEDTALSMLMQYGDKDEDAAKKLVDEWSLYRDTGIQYGDLKQQYLDGNLSREEAAQLMEIYGGKTEEEAIALSRTWEFEAKYGYTYDERVSKFKNGELSAGDLVDAMVEFGGKTRDEAKQSVYSYTREAYEDGQMTREQASKVMTQYCGKTPQEAKTSLTYIDLKQSLPDVEIKEEWIDEYYNDIAGSGISIETFIRYRDDVRDITGTGKKERRMQVIDSLPISNSQKDALYFAEGWAQSTLWEAPWH